jgi:3-hydroxy-9,10-secoandrosta-1,3,5(10)-triene-9,17-dione monooxygenase reductase component
VRSAPVFDQRRGPGRAADVYVRAVSYTADPFATPAALRDPARRLRGRLASPVTVWTSGAPSAPSGLTVSSILVAEGEPSSVLGLVNSTTDLWEAVEETGAFVVHVLERRHRHLAERFAGRMPSPGGLFRELVIEPSDWGPKLTDVPNRALCRLAGARQVGYHNLVEAAIEGVEVESLEDPLAFYQGRYRLLQRRDPEA